MKISLPLAIKAFLFACSCCVFAVPAGAQYLGQSFPTEGVKPVIAAKAYSFDLQDVRLLDSRFRQNMERDARWLLRIDNNRLLHAWRVNAGLPSSARAYGGWEGLDVELRGHSLGHVLSGLAMMYAATGDTAYKNKADSMVSALAECQQVLNQGGYISAFPQNLVDRVIKGEPVWAPWYTLHKVVAGLTDMYQYTGNRQALDVVSKMFDWTYSKLKDLTPGQLATMQRTEFGGMMETAYNLYGITGNPNYKKVAERFYHHAVFDPLLQHEDNLNKLHANTQIPKIIGEARGYELTGDDKQKQVADFFWQTVIDHHTYAMGGNSDDEHFFEPDQISRHLTALTTESCNTYNMLKLTRHLFTWNADEKYADYYERALYNHILASQDTSTGMVTYFTNQKPGLFKVYSTPENSFWCCVGTGFENHAKYAEGIYYHNDRGVFVNLFIPSTLHWKERGLRLSQRTQYPEESTTHLQIDESPATELPLYIRYPAWATGGATVTVNGKPIKVSQQPGSYITISRRWKAGDKIDITCPMSLRLVPANDDPNVVAIAYGPLVLVGDMGTQGIQSPAPYAHDQWDFAKYDVPADISTVLHTKGKKLTDWLKPVDGQPLTFKATGVAGKDLTLKPYYQVDRQRYIMYWNLE